MPPRSHEHTPIDATGNNLAGLLGQLGCFDGAGVLYREALAGRTLALGAAHAHTRGTAANLEGLLRAKAAAAHHA